MYTIAIVNEKGGTAKTTTSVNLSAALGELGHKVLLVDLDGQAASSRWLGIEEDTSFAEALYAGRGLKPLADVIPNVSLAPASGKLDAVAHDLRPTQGGQLRRLLNEVAEAFEFTIIDCPPSLGNRLIGNAMLAASHAVVPVETSILAMDGLKILLTTLDDVRQGFDHNIILAGVLACRFDPRTRLSRLVLAELRRALPGKVFDTVIRENVRLRECPASGQSILTYAPDSHAAEDYRAVAKELAASPRLKIMPADGIVTDLTAEMTAAEGDMKIGHALRQTVRKSIRDGAADEDMSGWKESLEEAKRRLEAEGVLTPEPEAANDSEPPVPEVSSAETAQAPAPATAPAGASPAVGSADVDLTSRPFPAPAPAPEPAFGPVSEPAPMNSAGANADAPNPFAPAVDKPAGNEPSPDPATAAGQAKPSGGQVPAWETTFDADKTCVGQETGISSGGAGASASGEDDAPIGKALETWAGPPAETQTPEVRPQPAGSPPGVEALSFRLDTTPPDQRVSRAAPVGATAAQDSQASQPAIKQDAPPTLQAASAVPLAPPPAWEQPAAEPQKEGDGVNPDCPHLRQVIQKMQWKKPDASPENKPAKKGLIARLLAKNAGK
ncbi:MAG: AAA family ATPase [Phycisphaerae bacterium]